MKKLISILLLLPLLFSFQTDVNDMCNDKEAKTNAIKLLGEYSYSSSKTSSFFFVNNEQIREIEVNLFEGEDYRFIFNNEFLPQNVEVRIYDKSKENKFRKMLFTSKDQPSQTSFIFEPSWKYKDIYINYVVPPATDSGQINKGCSVFVVGYKLNFIN